MTISISDKLTVHNSEKYVLSIRLWPGGFSFYGYDPSESESLFYRETEFDRTKPYISSLKEFFFENEFLSYTYKRTNVICVSPQYTLVPGDAFYEKEKERLLSFSFSSPDSRCLNNLLKEEQAEVVFGLDEELYEFCSRSLINPRFIHHITPLLALWKKQSRLRLPHQLFVVLHRKIMDVVCFGQGSLLFANSFEFEDSGDILYYILYVWKQLGLDQRKDQLQISGDTALRTNVTNTLQNYVQFVGLQEIPSEAYLLGAEIAQAPMDLIALSICEL